MSASVCCIPSFLGTEIWRNEAKHAPLFTGLGFPKLPKGIFFKEIGRKVATFTSSRTQVRVIASETQQINTKIQPETLGFRKEFEKETEELIEYFSKKHSIMNLEPCASKTAHLFFQIGASKEDIMRIFRRNPKLFQNDYCQLDEIVSVRNCVLKNGLDDSIITKLFVHYPYLPSKDLSEIEAILLYLKNDLQIKNIPRLISGCPSIFSYRKARLKSKIDYIQSLLSIEDIGSLVQRFPHLLTMKAETVEETYSKLVHVFGDEPALVMLKKHPCVIGLSWPTVKKKMDFVVDTMGRDLKEILLNPVILSYSLEVRLRPRYEAAKMVGLENKYGIGTMFCPSNDKFEARFGVKLDV